MESMNKVLINIEVSSITQLIACLEILKSNNITFQIIEEIPPSPSKPISKPLQGKAGKMGRLGTDVLALLSKGYSYERIADELGISIDGVRYYMKKIFKELGVNNGRAATNIYLSKLQN